MVDDIVIVAAKRTPVGRLGGALARESASSLGARVVRALLAETGVPAGEISEVIMGQVLTAGCGQNPARQAALGAGLPNEVGAMTINQVCGAGQKSLHLAAQAIRCGDAEIVIAGGQDSMSQAPYLLPRDRAPYGVGPMKVREAMTVDGLWDVFNDYHMGVTAENLVQNFQIRRDEQDEFALASQRKAADAIMAGRIDTEIVPVEVQHKREKFRVVEDESPRPDITIEKLSSLKPVFKEGGTVTAGNSSGLNDGAAAVMVMTRRRAEAYGLTPLAAIKAYATGGVDPSIMGLGPVPASRKCLSKAAWEAQDLDLIELNEAFAAQSLAVIREMDWDPTTINVNGGAIAFGHPLAASGCRIVVTLVHEMARRDAKRGLASMCIGGGMGVSICLER
ncbi:acetyl-CoA C-acetyltransferase [Acidocella sp.]|uniref:acetyl-CoA C-acetyltransferase n=1 Tax=Acidocella sp. TaxID=50710 RepID=UPI003D094490